MHHTFITPGFWLECHWSLESYWTFSLKESFGPAIWRWQMAHSGFSIYNQGHLEMLVHTWSSSMNKCSFVSSICVCVSTCERKWEWCLVHVCNLAKLLCCPSPLLTVANLQISLWKLCIAYTLSSGDFWLVLVRWRTLILYPCLEPCNQPKTCSWSLDSFLSAAVLLWAWTTSPSPSVLFFTIPSTIGTVLLPSHDILLWLCASHACFLSCSSLSCSHLLLTWEWSWCLGRTS